MSCKPSGCAVPAGHSLFDLQVGGAVSSIALSHRGDAVVLAGTSTIRRVAIGSITSEHMQSGTTMADVAESKVRSRTRHARWGGAGADTLRGLGHVDAWLCPVSSWVLPPGIELRQQSQELHILLRPHNTRTPLQDSLTGGGSLLSTQNSELPPLLGPVSELRDPVNQSKYTSAALSRDGEYLLAAAASKTGHVIRVWDSHTSAVAVVLEGPARGLQCAVWHPDPARCAPAICEVAMQRTAARPSSSESPALC